MLIVPVSSIKLLKKNSSHTVQQCSMLNKLYKAILNFITTLKLYKNVVKLSMITS